MKEWLKEWHSVIPGIIASIMIGLAPFAVPGATFSKENLIIAILISFFGVVCKFLTDKK